MHKLTLRHSGEIIELNEETSILQALRDQNIYIKSSCGANGSCSDCIVKVALGEDNVTEPTFDEMQLLGNVFHITKERLACQTKLTGDVTIDISAHDKKADEKKLKQKTSSFKKSKAPSETRVRKKEEVDEMLKERIEASSAKRQAQNEEWQKHWEKDKDEMKPKRLGGGKRPKLFRTDNIDFDSKKERNYDGDFKKSAPEGSAFPRPKKTETYSKNVEETVTKTESYIKNTDSPLSKSDDTVENQYADRPDRSGRKDTDKTGEAKKDFRTQRKK